MYILILLLILIFKNMFNLIYETVVENE